MTSRARHPSIRVRLQALLLACVAVAILGTQAIGLVHRVAHGGGGHGGSSVLHSVGTGAPAPAADSAETGHGRSTHSCAALDALALGSAPPIAIDAVPAVPAPGLLPPETPAIRARVAAHAFALARAPPPIA